MSFGVTRFPGGEDETQGLDDLTPEEQRAVYVEAFEKLLDSGEPFVLVGIQSMDITGGDGVRAYAGDVTTMTAMQLDTDDPARIAVLGSTISDEVLPYLAHIVVAIAKERGARPTIAEILGTKFYTSD